MAKIRVHDLAKELGMEEGSCRKKGRGEERGEGCGEGRSRSEKEESRVRSASAEFQEQQPYPGQTAGTAPGTFRTGKRKDSR